MKKSFIFVSIPLSLLLLLSGCGSSSETVIIDNQNQTIQTQEEISLALVNQAPIATFESFSINKGARYDGELKAIDPDGDKLKYVIVDKPVHGTVALHNNGCFTYIPNDGYQGSDTFSYRASDDVSSCAVKTVTVDVCKPILKTPKAPSDLTVDALSTSKLRLSWDADTNNDGYTIYQDGKLVATTDGDTFKNICGLKPNTTYSFEVRAKNKAGTSDATTATGTTKDVTTPPLAPTNLQAKAVDKTSLRLIWKDNADNESSYEIYQDGIKIKTISSSCSCTVVTGLTEGTTYNFVVKAVNKLGSSSSNILVQKTSGVEARLKDDTLSIIVKNGLKQEVPFTLNPSIENLPNGMTVKWFLDRKEITEGTQIDADGYHSLGAKLYKDSKHIKTIMTDLYGYTSKTVATFDAKKSSSSGVYIFEEDSDKLSGAEIDIPADALLKDTTITLKETSIDKIPKTLGMPVSKVLKLEPEGLTFNNPVTLTIPYDILNFNDVVVARYSNGVVDYIKPLYIDKVHKKVVFQTKHFTEFQLQTSWGFEKKKAEQSEIKDIETTLGLKYSPSEWEKMLNYKLYKDIDLTYYDVWLAYDENFKIREQLNKKKYTEAVKIAYPDSLSKMRKKIKSIEEAVSVLGYVETISSFDIKKPIRSIVMVITSLFDIPNDPKSAYLPPNELAFEQYNKIQTKIDDSVYEAIWDDFSSGYSMEQIRNSDVFTSLKDIVDDAMLKNLKIVFDRDKNFNQTTSLSHIKKLFESLHESIEFDKKELNIELSRLGYYTSYTDEEKIDIEIYLAPVGYGSDYKSSNPKLIIYDEKQEIKEIGRDNLLYDDEKNAYFATLSLNIPKMANSYKYKIVYTDDKGIKKEKRFFLKTEDRVVQNVTISKYEMKNQHYYKNGVFTAVLKPSFNQSNIHYAYTIKIGSLTYEGFSEVRSLSYDQIANIEILGIDKIIDGTDTRATQEDLRNIKIEFEVMETNYKLVGKNTFVFDMNEVIDNYVKKDIYTPEFIASTDEGMIEMPHDTQKISINTHIYFSDYFDSNYYKIYAHDIDGNGIFSKTDNPNYSYVFKNKGLYHPCIWIQNRQTLAKEKYCSVSFEVVDDITKIEIKTNTPPNKPTIVQNKTTLTANSTDDDGDDLKYIWKVISGDITLNHSYGQSINYTTKAVAANTTNSYTVEVFAHDGYNKSEPKQFTFTLSGETIIPLKADAGADITTTPDTQVTLDASKSTGDSITYSWRKKLPSGSYTPVLSTEEKWTFVAYSGISTYELKVTDTGGATSTDSIVVTSNPPYVAPVAKAGADVSINEGASVTLDASSTTGTNIDYYQWSETGVAIYCPNSISCKIDGLSVGEHTIKLTVSDGQTESVDSVKVVVNTVNTPTTSKVLKTGQTKCYNYDTSEEEVCTKEHRGQDGYYQMGLDRSYTRDDANEIVTDNTTGLIWQDDNNAKTVKKTYDEAKAYCENDVHIGGYSDWRLPTIKELQTLPEFGKYNPAIDSKFQNTSTSDYYWSSTTYVLYTSSAWNANFSYGNSNYSDKSYNYYVRCVRSGQ